MFDVNDVGALLHIAEKTLAFPKLKSLHDQAMTRLLQIAEDIKESPSFEQGSLSKEPGVNELGQKIEVSTDEVRRV